MIVLDLKSNKPIYEQIVEQMKFHVLKGHLKPGDAIPSVRKLALDIAITPGTVAKAYQELERDGIIYTLPAKGSFISGNMESIQQRREKALNDVAEAVKQALGSGCSEEEILRRVKESMKEEEKHD